MSKPPKISAYPQHVALDIKPSQTKMIKPLQQKNFKNVNHSVKERSRAFHKFSLCFSKNSNQNHFPIHKATSHLKQIKCLTRLEIQIGLLPFTHQGIKRLVQSFKHMKNLSVLHFYAVPSFDIPLGPQAVTLCQALKSLIVHDLPNVEVKLSFATSGSDDVNRDCVPLLKNFAKLRNFTSAQLNFSQYYDSPKIEELTKILTHSKSLSNLSLTLSSCTIYPFTRFHNLFTTLKGMKSLKSSKIHLRACSTITNEGLKKLLPALKGHNPQLQSLEIAFEDCTNKITKLEWWLFSNSIRRLKTSCKIKASFFGAKKGESVLLVVIFFLVLLFLIIAVPQIASHSAKRK